MDSIRALAVWVVVALLAGCSATKPAPTSPERMALAPTGALRVGVYPASPVSMVRDPRSGQPKGMSIELGKALAARLNVPFQMVEFAKLSDVVDAMRESRVDLMVTNATPARAQSMDFSEAVIEIEQGYLVMNDSPISSSDDVDRAGIQVLVVQGSTSQSVLPQQLHNASIVVVETIKAATEMLDQRKADAFATQKSILFDVADGLEGSKVLAGRYGVEQIAVGIPKGRTEGLPYLRKFVVEARADGTVARAIQSVGMRSTSVAQSR